MMKLVYVFVIPVMQKPVGGVEDYLEAAQVEHVLHCYTRKGGDWPLAHFGGNVFGDLWPKFARNQPHGEAEHEVVRYHNLP